MIVEGGRWEAGAAITFPFPPEVIDMTLSGTVLAVDEPKLLSFTWGDQETLRFELYPEGSGTRLVSSTSSRRAGRRGTRPAGRTASTGSAGLPADPGAWRRRFTAYSTAFEPEIGPQEGPPADFKGDV